MLTSVLELNYSKYLKFWVFTCFQYGFFVSGEVFFFKFTMEVLMILHNLSSSL